MIGTMGLNVMCEFVVPDGDDERPANKLWNDMYPRLKLTAMVEAWAFCASRRIIHVFMPRIIGELEEIGDTALLDHLVKIGVIVEKTEDTPANSQ